MKKLGIILVIIVLVATISCYDEDVPKLNINSFVHFNVNCSDLDRSRRFYELLGFREYFKAVPEHADEYVASTLGMPPYHFRGAIMAKIVGSGMIMVDLLEWIDPHDPEPPYQAMNHIGIARVALGTTDIDADYEKLKAFGVEFISEPHEVEFPEGCTSKFVLMKDPDGTVIELVESPPLIDMIKSLLNSRKQ